MATWYVSTTGLDTNAGTSTGSPFLTISKALSSAASGDTIAIKAGTYTVTSTLGISSTLTTITLQGYQTTPGDGGTRPLITTATSSVDLFSFNGTNGGIQTFDNLQLSNTAATRANGFVQLNAHNTTGVAVFMNCQFDGFSTALNWDDIGAHFNLTYCNLLNVEIKNCTSNSMNGNVTNTSLIGCYIHNNGNPFSSQGFIVADNSIFDSNTGNGLYGGNSSPGLITARNCVFSNNTGSGVRPNGSGSNRTDLFMNCIFWGNGAYGIDGGGTNSTQDKAAALIGVNNAFGSNTSGSLSFYNSLRNSITLTASPFTSSSNFALNSATGGGALLKAAGFPGVMPAGTGYADVGALQSQGTGGGGSSSSGFSYCFVA